MSMKTKHPVRLRPVQMQIVRALADNSLNVSKTARELYRSKSGMQHQLARIRECTGLDPTNFYDLNELLYAEEVAPDEDL